MRGMLLRISTQPTSVGKLHDRLFFTECMSMCSPHVTSSWPCQPRLPDRFYKVRRRRSATYRRVLYISSKIEPDRQT
jgi:hypothetical protein